MLNLRAWKNTSCVKLAKKQTKEITRMGTVLAALSTEALKIRRSKLTLATAIAFVVLPAMIALVATGVLSHATAGSDGGPNAKDWTTYLGLILQVYSGAAVLGMGFVASWIFGREYSDRTAKDLLALPASRTSIVAAKFMIMAIWGIILSLLTLATALALGALLHLEGGSSSVITEKLGDFGAVLTLTLALSPPVAMVASITKGYLAGVGLAVSAVLVAQFAGGLGIGQYFPWQIPAEYLAAAAGNTHPLGLLSYGIIAATAVGGLVGTWMWWRYADQV
jgi:ABC-2 type transport system permease protein